MNKEEINVTLMGDSGKRIANIIWKENLGMFKVEFGSGESMSKLFKLFKEESEAQQFAAEYVWEKKYGNI